MKSRSLTKIIGFLLYTTPVYAGSWIDTIETGTSQVARGSIDLVGSIADRIKPYANMAKIAYGDNNVLSKLSADEIKAGGWNQGGTETSRGLLFGGMTVTVFSREANGKIDYVIAFKGSDGISLSGGALNAYKNTYQDWLLANLEQVRVGPSRTAQYKDGLEVTLKLIAEIKEATPNANIVLTGHSLGGGIAQYVASETGLNAITFNAAGLSMRAGYRSGSNYNVANVNSTSDGVHKVPLTAQIGQSYKFDPTGGLPQSNPFNFADNHGMDQLLFSLDSIVTNEKLAKRPFIDPKQDPFDYLTRASSTVFERLHTTTALTTPITIVVTPTPPLVIPGTLTPIDPSRTIRFEKARVYSSFDENLTPQNGEILAIPRRNMNSTVRVYSTALSRGTYRYSDWGEWDGTIGAPAGSNRSKVQYLVGYNPVKVAALPLSGSATYRGEALGAGRLTASGPDVSVGGNVSMTANFATRMMGGSMALNTPGQAPFFTGRFVNSPIQGLFPGDANSLGGADSTGNSYAGFVFGDTNKPNLNFSGTGLFLGQQSNGVPAELGGNFLLFGGGLNVGGVWRAQQTRPIIVGEN